MPRNMATTPVRIKHFETEDGCPALKKAWVRVRDAGRIESQQRATPTYQHEDFGTGRTRSQNPTRRFKKFQYDFTAGLCPGDLWLNQKNANEKSDGVYTRASALTVWVRDERLCSACRRQNRANQMPNNNDLRNCVMALDAEIAVLTEKDAGRPPARPIGWRFSRRLKLDHFESPAITPILQDDYEIAVPTCPRALGWVARRRANTRSFVSIGSCPALCRIGCGQSCSPPFSAVDDGNCSPSPGNVTRR